MPNNITYPHSYQNDPLWMDQEGRLLATGNGHEEGGNKLHWSLRRALVLVAIALFGIAGINLVVHASNPNGTFLLIGDVPLLGKSHHHKKKSHHKKKEDEEPAVVDCDALLEGVFESNCMGDSGMSAGVFAAVGVEAGMVAISAADGGIMSEYSFDDGDLANASNCERSVSVLVSPDWEEATEGVASYNVEAKDDDTLLWALADSFCVLSRLGGHHCRDTLKDLTKDFERALEGVNETTVDLELFTKDLC